MSKENKNINTFRHKQFLKYFIAQHWYSTKLLPSKWTILTLTGIAYPMKNKVRKIRKYKSINFIWSFWSFVYQNKTENDFKGCSVNDNFTELTIVIHCPLDCFTYYWLTRYLMIYSFFIFKRQKFCCIPRMRPIHTVFF